MLKDETALGSAKVFSIMQDVYGREHNIKVMPELQAYFGVGGGVLRPQLREQLDESFFTISPVGARCQMP